jgi:hypothetical protein
MSVSLDHSRENNCAELCYFGLRERPRLRRTITIVTVLACTLLLGCGRDPIIWSASSESPDGHWTAVAYSVQHTGPGANSVDTIVEIKELKRNILFRYSEKVLGFMDDGASMALKMNWVSPSHLEVVFNDDPKMLYHQVVRTSGIEISVRDLSNPRGLAQ